MSLIKKLALRITIHQNEMKIQRIEDGKENEKKRKKITYTVK